MTVGRHHACALLRDGTVRCWGGNAFGQLGDGSTRDHDNPVGVLGLEHIVQISAGEKHSCARSAQGEVFCWGSNSDAQLGDGTTLAQTTALRVLFGEAQRR